MTGPVDVHARIGLLTGPGACPGWHAGFREFGRGWVIWLVPPSYPAPAGEPATGVGLRCVLDAGTGRLRWWPPLRTDDIMGRIRAGRPDDRFPPQVVANLEASGWYPGRRLEQSLHPSALRVLGPPEEAAFSLHETARSVLTEFGGLRVAVGRREPFTFEPSGHTFDPYFYDLFEEESGQRMCPIGVSHSHVPYELVLGDGGLVLLTYNNDTYVVGGSFDEALVNLMTATDPFPEFEITDDVGLGSVVGGEPG